MTQSNQPNPNVPQSNDDPQTLTARKSKLQHALYDEPALGRVGEETSPGLYNQKIKQEILDQGIGEVDQDEKKGGFKIGGKTIMLLFLLVGIIGIAYYINTSETPIQKTIGSQLNGEYGNEIPEYRVGVKSFIQDPSITTFELTEADVMLIFNQKFEEEKVDRVEIEEGKITLFKNIGEELDPLWFGVEIVKKENIDGGFEYSIQKIGFGKISIPENISGILSEKIFGKLGDSVQEGISKDMIAEVAGEEVASVLNPDNVEFTTDKLIINLDQGIDGVNQDDLRKLLSSF